VEKVESVKQKLEAYLSRVLPESGGVAIRSLDRSPEGFSQETFFFEVEFARDGARRSYVAKREPVAGLLEPYDLEPEFRVLHALSDHPLPSPPTPWFETDPAVLERPFYVMEKLPGSVPIPAALADGSPPLNEAQRKALAPQVIQTLADLHTLDWNTLGFDFLGVPATGTEVARRELDFWEGVIVRSELQPPPALAEALDWLRRSPPEADEITLVHGDYRLGNWLIDGPDEESLLTGVLDWELVHLGDPVEDVAWCASHLWRARTPWAAALMDPDEFVASYERASGRRVDPEKLHWYYVLSVVKMAAIMVTGIRAFNDGRSRDLRMAIFDHQLPFLCALLAVQRGWLPESVMEVG
jgi:aminoglycoside phosphotransferase (APT) family kinase protein